VPVLLYGTEGGEAYLKGNLQRINSFSKPYPDSSGLPLILTFEPPVAILVPRHRTIGVRLSEEEYTSLEKFCVESGSRSISDLARSAIASFLSHMHRENALTSTVKQHSEQVKDLERKIERLSAEIALLRAVSTPDLGPIDGNG
jgi:hypothetical protein